MSRKRDWEYYPYIGLATIGKYEKAMQELGVSQVARSPRGFLTYYKKVGGDQNKVNDYWDRRRSGFIARHLAQYESNPAYRRKLALIAWAYMP